MLEPQDAALACPVLTGSLVQENQIPYALSGIEGIMWISERNRVRGPMMYDDHEGRGRITPTVRKNATSWAHVHQKRRVAPFEHRGSTRRHRHDPPKRMNDIYILHMNCNSFTTILVNIDLVGYIIHIFLL